MTRLLDRVHLAWLVAILPAATLVFMSQRAAAPPVALLAVGALAAALYLWAAVGLTPRPTSAWWGLLMLVDGPLFALAGGWTELRGAAIRVWLVEGSAIGLATVGLGLVEARRDGFSRPSTAALGVLVLALAGVWLLAWPVLPALAAEGPRAWGWIAAGAVQGALVRARQVRRGQEVDRPELAAFLVAGLVGYAAAFIGGALLGQAGRAL